MKLLSTIAILMILQELSFKKTQQRYSRVKSAYDEKEYTLKHLFETKSLQYEGFNLFLRAFKKEMKLEVWIKEKGKETFTLLHQYSFCTTSGSLGPKRKEGDLQIPEGIYHISHFNPQSNFHLSLGLNYPNSSDRILGDPKYPGSSIYIHGNCATIGCIPITDDKIKELYLLAVEARNNGQQKIPVHIFPSRLDENNFQTLKQQFNSQTDLHSFWMNLQTVYQKFEDSRTLNTVKINSRGEYYF